MRVKNKLRIVVTCLLIGAGAIVLLPVAIFFLPIWYTTVHTPPRPLFRNEYIWMTFAGYQWEPPWCLHDEIENSYMVDVRLNLVLVVCPRPVADSLDSDWFRVWTTESYVEIKEYAKDAFFERIIRFTPEENTAYIVAQDLTLTKVRLCPDAAQTVWDDFEGRRLKQSSQRNSDIISFLKDLTIPDAAQPPQVKPEKENTKKAPMESGGETGNAVLLVISFLFLGLILWSTIWAYNNAKVRGKSGCLVALLVFLFWPMGLLAWLIFRPNGKDRM